MDRSQESVDAVGQVGVCPNCGHRQVFSAINSRCDACGSLVDSTMLGQGEVASEEPVGVGDPADVAPAMASGGIGDTPDGTQVTFQVPTAVPGKPMAPNMDDPAGNDSFAQEAMEPGGQEHAERGASE
jgi:hypothetical protein